MRAIARAFVAGMIGVAATLIGLAVPAFAVACTQGTGVTVVVNGSVKCYSGGGGRTADVYFDKTGHDLKYASRQPGFVCKVDGSPASDPCVNASPSDAYWGLFWSDGTSGSWVYASAGVKSVKVKTGGWVAFVFQTGSRKNPSMSPVGPAAPKPTTAAPKPKKTTPKPTATTKPSATQTAQATDSDDSDSTPGEKLSGEARSGADEAAAPQVASDDVNPTAAETDQEGSSTATVWIAAILGVGLVGATVVIARARSQRS